MNYIKITSENLCEIEKSREFFPDCWTADMVKQGLDGGRLNGLYSTENGEITGFILFSTGVEEGDIESVFVFPEKRKRGTGKALVISAVNGLKDKGAKKVFLEVRESNFPAVNLYTGVGFKEISRRKKYYPDGENAVVMVKEL